MSTATDADRDAANQTVANLFVKLLTDSCKDSARSALRFEGQATLQSSFQVLGQVAGMELFSDPEVAKGMAGLDKHVDPAKLKSLTDETSAPR